mmetsp:Transcript_110820/g.155533  ORF Transcript_110820/g.155533 Transcript_110820/m.155533 type:complete len:87 (+) Transcript_110820:418-678(+)
MQRRNGVPSYSIDFFESRHHFTDLHGQHCGIFDVMNVKGILVAPPPSFNVLNHTETAQQPGSHSNIFFLEASANLCAIEDMSRSLT